MNRCVYFIGHPRHMESGSSILRSSQLCDIARGSNAFADFELAVSSDSDRSDSVLIFNKNALERTREADIVSLKRRGNHMIADPLDGLFDDDRLSAFDCVIASSMLQYDDYKTRYPGRAVYVGHHVDTRIGPVAAKPDGFSMGYFGETVNARYADDLTDRIAIIQINTRKGHDIRWMSRLADHNAHYAIRSVDLLAGFKPFTKGFIAAHCGAPILVADHDLEARQFLPPCYPYFTATDSPRSVWSTIARMAEDFRSREWARAVSAMDELRQASFRPAIAGQIHAAVSTAF